MSKVVDEPGRIHAFKIDSGKLPYSQNVLRGCAYSECSAKRTGGGKPLLICSGCRSVRFCCREHQVAFWPLHKAFCKQQIKSHKLIEEKQEYRLSDPRLPPLQDRVRLAQDWIELHRFALDGARTRAAKEYKVPLNYRLHYYQFDITYRTGGEGNPSMAFTLDNARICEHGLPGSWAAERFAPYMLLVERTNEEGRLEPLQKEGYIGTFICSYRIDNEHEWLTSSFVNDRNISKSGPPEGTWYSFVQWCALWGVVFRLINGVIGGKPETYWTPGLLEKKWRKWTWDSQTREEFALKGIDLPACMG